jgi:RHS repeat-associated protein
LDYHTRPFDISLGSRQYDNSCFPIVVSGNAGCSRSVICPSGYNFLSGVCFRSPGAFPFDTSKNKGQCPAPTGGSTNTSHPINIGAGNKFLIEQDIPANSAGLQFQRAYNSLTPSSSTVLGTGWQHNYNLTLSVDVVIGSGQFSSVAAAFRSDGRIIKFVQALGSTSWVSDTDVTDRLQTVTDGGGAITGYQLIDGKSDRVESYNTSGNLTAINDPRSAQTFSFVYDTNLRLKNVADKSGRQLQIGYDSYGRITDVWQPDSVLGDANSPHWHYAYDTSSRLMTVTTPANTTHTYEYENTSLANVLTGIVDENSNRYVTYAYDAQGRASGENLWSGPSQTLPVDQYTLSYQANNLTQVTDPLGQSRNFQFKVVQGVAVLDNVSQPCALCGGSGMTKSRTYDPATGFTNLVTDFNGYVTSYNYNSRGLETERIEASNTSGTGSPKRTIDTTWEANFRVPDQRSVTNAGGTMEALTKWAYNTRGQVLARCQVDPAVSGASSYTCGSATNAPTGVRQWTYTYCENVGTCPLIGLTLSVDGPRTDVSDVTTYGYYQTTDISGCATLGGACHSLGDLYRVTNALGQITTYVSYDKNGRVTRMQDANGTYTDMTYHPRGWLLTRTVRANADGSANTTADATTTFAYDNVGNVTQITQPDQTYLHYVYDTAHRLIDIYDSSTPSNYLNGNHIHYTLDAAGNRTGESTYDPTNTIKRSLSRQYDQLNRLTKTLNATSQAVQTYSNPAEAPPTGITYTDGYDGNGNAIYSVDGLNAGTEQQYDPLNRLIKTLQDHTGQSTATKDTTTQYAYDARDNLRSVTDPDNLITNYTYDGLNNLTLLASPDTGSASYTYDDAGNRVMQLDARNVKLIYVYDALNRLTSIFDPLSNLNVTYAYDEPNITTQCPVSYPIGRLTTMTDSSGSTVYCYDRRGNVISKTQTIPNTTPKNWALASNGSVASASSTYSSAFPVSAVNNGDEIGQQWANGGGWNDGTQSVFPDYAQITFMGPQTLSSVTVVTLQDNYTAPVVPTDSMTFTQYGLTSFDVQVWSNGAWTTVGSSVTGNNLVKRTVAFAPVTTTMVRIKCNGSADNNTWSRIVEIEAWGPSSPRVSRVQTSYTVADRIASITYPSNAVVTYTRNAIGQISSIAYQNGPTQPVTLVSAATYLPFGPLNQMTYGNGRVQTRAYDQNYGISAITDPSANGLNIGYTLDVMGNLQNASSPVTANPPTQSYQYDPLYRLANVKNASNTSIDAFTYGKTGDRLSEVTPTQSPSYTYTAGTHQLHSVGGATRNYDLNGNTQTANANSFTYDTHNRLSQANTVAYSYNGKGERVSKSSPGTLFAYSESGQLLGEYDNTGTAQREYIYLDSLPVAVATSGQLNYVETDHLGTPREVLQPATAPANDTLVWKWDFFGSAFGTNQPSPQTLAVNLRFPGQYYDAEAGLNYNGVRDYESGTGRYIESDPIGLRGGNDTYAYANNSPLIYFDRFGFAASSSPQPEPDKKEPNSCPEITKKTFGGCGCADTSPNLATCLACCGTIAGRKRSPGGVEGGSICAETCYRKAGITLNVPNPNQGKCIAAAN